MLPVTPEQDKAIRSVTAEMRRFMPNACGDWADRIDAALATPKAADPTSVAGERAGEWPERAIRIAEALEHEVVSMRGDSLWCRLCDQDVGADGQQHAAFCVLANAPEAAKREGGE